MKFLSQLKIFESFRIYIIARRFQRNPIIFVNEFSDEFFCFLIKLLVPIHTTNYRKAVESIKICSTLITFFLIFKLYYSMYVSGEMF